MKRFILSILLLTAFISPAFATDITISQSTIPNANLTGLPAQVTGTATVINGSADVTFAVATIPSQYVGIGGWQIKLGNDTYTVLSADSRQAITLTDNYVSSSGSVSAIIYPAIALQIYADAPFTPNGATYVVQSGSVGGRSGFFFRTACTVRRVAGVQSVFIPAIVLPSPLDAVNNIERSVRYSARFFQLNGADIGVFDGFDSFQLPASPTSNTWPTIRTYNVPIRGDILDNSTLSRSQILAITSNVAAGNINLGSASKVTVSDSSGRLTTSSVATTDLNYLAAADPSTRGTARKGERARYAIASLPTCNSGSVDVTVNVSDGNKGQRTCHEVSSGVYGWVDDRPIYNIAAFGASSSASAATNSTAIQAAITAANAAGGGTVEIPFGTYFVTPASTATWEGSGTMNYCFDIYSNVHFIAEKGAVFKIADNVSTDASPKQMAMFFTNAVRSNVSWKGLTFDMNGANNLISPLRGSDTYNRYNQGSIFVSGTPSGVAARIDNVLIDDCSFINNPGVSSICMQQSNIAGITLSKNWKILNCYFNNNGIDTDDHSTIFGWADDVVVENCIFTNPVPFGTTGRTGGNTSYEIHGSNQRYVKNKVVNYLQGIWVSSNFTSTVKGSIIADNEFYTMFFGVNFFRTVGTLTAIQDTIIERNIFNFDDTAVAAISALNFKTAVAIGSEYEQGYATIRSNKIFKSGTSIASAFFSLSSPTVAGQKHTGITVENNEGRGTTFGTLVRTSAVTGLGVITIRNNHWKDLTPAGIFAITSGDSISPTAAGQSIDVLTLGGGSVIDTRVTSQTNYGTFIESTSAITQLTLEPKSLKNILTAEYTDAGATITTKRGMNVISQTVNSPVYLDASRNLVAATGVTFSGGNISTIAGFPSFTGGYGTVGTASASSGLGGNWRYRDDTGTSRWLGGILGSGGATDFSIYDIVNSKSLFTVTPNATASAFVIGASSNTMAQPLTVTGAVGATSFKFTNLLSSSTAPTITSAGTSPSVTVSNGTASFRVDVGTGGTAHTVVLAMPAASNGWNCFVNNLTAAAANRADWVLRQTASTTTSVTIQMQTLTTGAAQAFSANDVISCQCTGH